MLVEMEKWKKWKHVGNSVPAWLTMTITMAKQ
jgi:hypothetical protein